MWKFLVALSWSSLIYCAPVRTNLRPHESHEKLKQLSPTVPEDQLVEIEDVLAKPKKEPPPPPNVNIAAWVKDTCRANWLESLDASHRCEFSSWPGNTAASEDCHGRKSLDPVQLKILDNILDFYCGPGETKEWNLAKRRERQDFKLYNSYPKITPAEEIDKNDPHTKMHDSLSHFFLHTMSAIHPNLPANFILNYPFTGGKGRTGMREQEHPEKPPKEKDDKPSEPILWQIFNNHTDKRHEPTVLIDASSEQKDEGTGRFKYIP